MEEERKYKEERNYKVMEFKEGTLQTRGNSLPAYHPSDSFQ